MVTFHSIRMLLLSILATVGQMLAVAVAGAVVEAAGFKMVEGVVLHLLVVAEETCRVVPYQRLQIMPDTN